MKTIFLTQHAANGKPNIRHLGPSYIFQVVVDKDGDGDPEVQNRLPHRITVCAPFQLENLLPAAIEVIAYSI